MSIQSRRQFLSQAAAAGAGALLANTFSDLGNKASAAAQPTSDDPKPIHTSLKLTLEPLTPQAWAPFGVILTPDGRERLPINTYGDKLDLYHDSFESDQPVEWFIGDFRPRWNGALFLERHTQITQTFIPIGGQPFVMVVAPPNCREENGFPALDQLKAFHIPGTSPVQIHRLTWHENPFPTQAQRLLVTAHRTLIKGHIKGGYDKALDAMPVDLERRWYYKEGYEITF